MTAAELYHQAIEQIRWGTATSRRKRLPPRRHRSQSGWQVRRGIGHITCTTPTAGRASPAARRNMEPSMASRADEPPENEVSGEEQWTSPRDNARSRADFLPVSRAIETCQTCSRSRWAAVLGSGGAGWAMYQGDQASLKRSNRSGRPGRGRRLQKKRPAMTSEETGRPVPSIKSGASQRSRSTDTDPTSPRLSRDWSCPVANLVWIQTKPNDDQILCSKPLSPSLVPTATNAVSTPIYLDRSTQTEPDKDGSEPPDRKAESSLDRTSRIQGTSTPPSVKPCLKDLNEGLSSRRSGLKVTFNMSEGDLGQTGNQQSSSELWRASARESVKKPAGFRTARLSSSPAAIAAQKAYERLPVVMPVQSTRSTSRKRPPTFREARSRYQPSSRYSSYFQPGPSITSRVWRDLRRHRYSVRPRPRLFTQRTNSTHHAAELSSRTSTTDYM